jgi:hypothetical protein
LNQRRGIHPRNNHVEPIQGGEEDLKRIWAPQTLSQLRKAWIDAHAKCPTMPPSHERSAAETDEDFDDGKRYVSKTLMLQGEEIANPYCWIEIAVPNVYISKTRPGHRLVKNDHDDFYMFRRMPSQNIWFSAEHGIGLCLEDDGEVKVLHSLNPRDICGPQLYGKNREYAAYPYYQDALDGCDAAYAAHNDFVRYEYRLEQCKREEEEFERYQAVEAAMRKNTNDTMLFVASVAGDKKKLAEGRRQAQTPTTHRRRPTQPARHPQAPLAEEDLPEGWFLGIQPDVAVSSRVDAHLNETRARGRQ